MRIIKKGRRKKCFMEVTCKECGAILEICSNDIRVKLDEHLGIMSLGKFLFECPFCKRINIMVSDELSDDMRSELEKRETLK